jgi:hypothetical protein
MNGLTSRRSSLLPVDAPMVMPGGTQHPTSQGLTPTSILDVAVLCSASSSGSVQGLGPEAGCSAVWVGVQGAGLVGCVSARDSLRPDAADTVKRLQERGVR